jgi:hypothetical protein
MGEWTTEERVGREVHGFVQHTEKIKGERDRERDNDVVQWSRRALDNGRCSLLIFERA